MPHDPREAMKDKIGEVLNALRIEAIERGMPPADFTLALIENIAVIEECKRLASRLAMAANVDAGR